MLTVPEILGRDCCSLLILCDLPKMDSGKREKEGGRSGQTLTALLFSQKQ